MYRVVTYVIEQNRYIQRGPGVENRPSPQVCLAWLAMLMENRRGDPLHFAECMDQDGNSQWRLSVGGER